MIMIEYVTKETLYPSFGMYYSDGRIQIRNDLPSKVKDFVLAHELYHSTDKATHWIWREIKANIVAFMKHPLGGLITFFMSLAPYRLKYYYHRFKTNQ